VQQTKPAMKNEGGGRIEAFQYLDDPNAPAESAWEGWEEPAAPQPVGVQESGTASLEAGLRAEFDRRLAEETRRSFEAGKEKGRTEGRQTEHEAQAESVAAANERHRRQGIELMENLAQERERYMREVEHEVVDLALAVAARILRREAQMDPLLLTGAVRVALGQLSGSTEVRVSVPQGDLALWTETLALLPNLHVKPQVTAREGMRLGDCVIETQLGSVDLGIRAQLGEIERGFFDRAGGIRKETGGENGVVGKDEGRHAVPMEVRQ
jgi:flagellar assembly protein FliH